MKLLCILVNLSFLFCYVTSLAVMSVDLGTEWMKIAIVSPGVPMEIVLNKESQRKTPVTVSFRDGERLFGDAAMTIAVRFPEKSYSHFLQLIGVKIDNPIVAHYQQRFPYHKIEKNEKTGGIVFMHPEGLSFTPEELLGMILKYAQEIAENAAGQTIKDAVVTVPTYFNQAQRRALRQAAEIVGLKVLQLMNANTAVALNYGIFRRKDFNETPQNIMFFDMGSSSSVATIVGYQVVKTKERGYTETIPQLVIKGIGFDRNLGGLEMQIRLRDHLANLFKQQKKTKTEVEKSNRAMAKLAKEAERVKKVLSANSDHLAQIENLLEDIDFRSPVDRETLDKLCGDLFEKVVNVIDMALKSASIDKKEIDQVIIVGGSTRVPKVQQKLLETMGVSELGKNVNADEAAALGAVYQAAYLSKGFKVKQFQVKDSNIYPIEVSFVRDVEQEGGTKGHKLVKRVLFSHNNPYPQKKVITFNRHSADFEIFVNYGDVGFLPQFELQSLGNLNLSKAQINGVEAALLKHGGETSEPKGVKAHFSLDESGVLNLDQVESVFEKKTEEQASEQNLESTLTKIGSTLGKLFSHMSGQDSEDATSQEETATQTPEEASSSNEKQEPPKSDEKANETTPDVKANETSPDGEASPEPAVNKTEPVANKTATNTTSKGSETTNQTKKEPKILTVKEPLATVLLQLDMEMVDSGDLSASRKKLSELDERDKARMKRDKAKNTLESFILETKDKLYLDEFGAAVSESEKENILKKVSEVGDWLEYESDDVDTELFIKKLDSLKSLTNSWFQRVKEHRERPEALSALHDVMNLSEIFLGGIKNMTEDTQIFTEVEITTLEKLITDTKKWRADLEKEQASLPLTEFPKLTIKSISEKITALDREVKYLINKARITPPKKKPEEPTKTEETIKTEETNQTDADKTKEMPKTTEQKETKSEENEIKEEEVVIPSPDTPEDETPKKPDVPSEEPTPVPDETTKETHSEL